MNGSQEQDEIAAMTSFEQETNELSALLTTQEILGRSMELTNRAMSFDDDGNLAGALELYIKASELLLEAVKFEENESIRSVISGNLDSIMTRMKTIEQKVAISNILANIQQTKQLNEKILNHSFAVDDESNVNEINSMETENDNDNNEEVDVTDVDDMLSNLYKQFYGHERLDQSHVSDRINTNSTNDIDTGNINLSFLETLDEKIDKMIQEKQKQREQDKKEHDDEDVNVNYETRKFNTLLKLDNYFHRIPNVLSLGVVPFGEDDRKNVFKNRLIEGLPDSVCCYILSFLTYYQLSHIMLRVSKYWRNELLTDLNTFINLWHRIVIGSDPLLYSFGHNMHVSWLNNYFLKHIRENCKELIVATGIANGSIDLSIKDIINVFQRNKFPKLKV